MESLNSEIWNYLNNGCLSLPMGAHDTFARIAIGQVIKEKVNKNTQTSSGKKGYSLKSGAVACYYFTAE